jgi:non-ribosomal peptide synthetase component F
LSQREGVTVFMTLLAVFKVLLNRYTGQEDIIVGANIANRNRTDTEGLVGFFVNNLVMRTDLSGEPTFRELLGRVREMALGAYAHQDLPFEMLVEELHPERDEGQMPLFQVLFVLQNVPTETLEISGVSFKPIRADAARSKFDLTLFVTETDRRLDCSFEYNTDLFNAATIEQMGDDFRDLLTQVLADPENTISSYSLVPEGQSTEITNDFQCAISNDL